MSDFKTLLGAEYRFMDEHKHLGDNIHLLVYGGSRAYGTNLPSSDVDIRGIATNTATNILTGYDFGVFTNEETDTVIYSLNKIFSLLAECNPNTIEILCVRDEDVIYMDDIGKMLRDNREIFLSNRCINTFGGYANQQLYRLRQKTLAKLSETDYNKHIADVIGNMNEHLKKSYGLEPFIEIKTDNLGLYAHVKETDCSVDVLSGLTRELNNVICAYKKNSARNEKALAHNKINKHAMHLIRLYKMATELMLTGTVYTYRTAEHELLMSIRNGEYCDENGQMNAAFFDLVRAEEQNFNEAKSKSKLPDSPDYDAINQLMIKINRMVVTGE